MPEPLKTRAFLLRKQPYSESSLILQVFSEQSGQLSILAKGLYKNKQSGASMLNVMNEYEFIISDASEGKLHILKEFSVIREFPADLPLETWVCAQAGLELVSKLIINKEDAPLFYQALQSYLYYLEGVITNPITITWRFFLRIYKLLGIPIDMCRCSVCQSDMAAPRGFRTGTGQLVCPTCLPVLTDAVELSPEAGKILSLLPVIGNYINDIVLTPELIRSINFFFLNYLNCQFHNRTDLKSLHYFSKFDEQS
jgi:DNA repair protein RecO